MFSTNSTIKVGHGVEYAYDVVDWAPFNMKLVEGVDHYVTIVTDDMDTITITKDTRLLTARGIWVRADRLEQGEVLKHSPCNTTVLQRIWLKTPIDMYEVSGTDYVTVNGFVIDC